MDGAVGGAEGPVPLQPARTSTSADEVNPITTLSRANAKLEDIAISGDLFLHGAGLIPGSGGFLGLFGGFFGLFF